MFISRVGQNRIYAPYMAVYLVISLPNVPYMHRIYMVLANPIYKQQACMRQKTLVPGILSSFHILL